LSFPILEYVLLITLFAAKQSVGRLLQIWAFLLLLYLSCIGGFFLICTLCYAGGGDAACGIASVAPEGH
jgi:hypothetical protein